MVTIPEYIKNPLFGTAVILAALIYSGKIIPKDRYSYHCLIPNNDIEELEGKIVSTPLKTGIGNTLYTARFRVYRAISKNGLLSSCKGNVKIFIPSNLVELHYPDKLFTAGKTKQSFIIEQGLICKFKIHTITGTHFIVSDPSAIAWGNNLYGTFFHFRAVARIAFRRILIEWGSAGGLLLALISGAREYTDPLLTTAFRQTGLSFLLALSGMHLTLFSSISILIGKRSGSVHVMELFRLFTLFIFVWFAGLSPSLFRAIICVFLICCINFLHLKKTEPLLILAASFIIQIIISPQDAVIPSFILSYGALCGILIFSPIIEHYLSHFLFSGIASSLADSMGAQILTAPVSLHFFGLLCPSGIIAAIFAGPLIELFIYAGCIGIVSSLALPFLSPAIRATILVVYKMLSTTVLVFAKIPAVTL